MLPRHPTASGFYRLHEQREPDRIVVLIAVTGYYRCVGTGNRILPLQL